MKKKIMVTRSSIPPYEEYCQEIKKIWETHWLTNMGEKHKALEKQLKEYLEVPNVSLFSNGHMALELAIQAFQLEGEVITTPFTFVSTTHAIVRNGLKPVFCDIREDNYTIDPQKIEKLITDKTSAIIPVHVYGNVCNIEEIHRIAEKYNLKVIYDAAHAFGVKYKGKAIGNFGDATMFSFHATKVFNTIEGGAVTFKNDAIGEKLYRLKNFGILDEETVDSIGANAKMNEFQAAMGICNLRHINEEIEKRKIVVKHYDELLRDVSGITIPQEDHNTLANFAYYPVFFDKEKFGKTRNEIFDTLKKNGVIARKYFYPLITDMICYSDTYSEKKFPIAKKISEGILTLPLYSDLKIEDVEYIVGIIRDLKRN